MGNQAAPTIYQLSTATSAKHNTTTSRVSSSLDLVVHELTDAQAGGLGPWGTINYAQKSLNVKLVDLTATTDSYTSDHEDGKTFEDPVNGASDAQKGGAYTTAAVGEELLATSTVQVTYATGFAGATAHTESFSPPIITIDLCPYTTDYVVPGSVQFTWMGQVYEDFEGILYRGRTNTAPGIVSGSIDYTHGIASVTDYVVGPGGFALNSLWTCRRPWTTASVFMRTQAAPLSPSPAGFVMTLVDTLGNAITATGDGNGNLTGNHLRGRVEYATGIVEMQFGDYVLDSALTSADKDEWWYRSADVGAVQAGKVWRPWPVDPSTLRYNSVSFFYLPMDAALLGLDPVRLPPDGRVVMYRRGEQVFVSHTATLGPQVVANGQTLDCSRQRLSRVRVVSSTGATIDTGYAADLDAGTVTFTDVSGYAQPVSIQHRIEDRVLVTDVQIDGTLTFAQQLSHNFPVGSVVSSALQTGTLSARVSTTFGQQTWDGVTWSDTLLGNASVAKYNAVLAPLVVTNTGAVTERWALRFTNSTTFECIGEHVGNIGSGTINADFSPINPNRGVPYFVVNALGWGSGWVPGNIVRINTVAAIAPFAAIRTVQPGPAVGVDYSFEILGLGDVNRPAP